MSAPHQHDEFRELVYKPVDQLASVLGLERERTEELLVQLCETAIEAQELSEAASAACGLLADQPQMAVELTARLIQVGSRLDTLSRRLAVAGPSIRVLHEAMTKAVRSSLGLSEASAERMIWQYLREHLGPPPR